MQKEDNITNDVTTNTLKAIISEDDIEQVLDRPFLNQELLYADIAIGIGKDYGVLKNDEYALAL